MYVHAHTHIYKHVCIYVYTLSFILSDVSNDFCYMLEKKWNDVFFRMGIVFLKIPLVVETVGF